MEQSSDNKFCQSTSCILYNSGTEGVVFTPEKGVNLVSWDDVGDGHETLPSSLWRFDDPNNPERLYLASFGRIDVSNKTERFQVKVVGRLWNFSTEVPEEPDDAMIRSGPTAELIVAGQEGKYDTMAAFVCFR